MVGINTIGGILKQIADFLKLRHSSTYTGHCFRRTSATLLADAGVDITVLKRHGNWKSATVAESYIENSIENKLQILQQSSEKISVTFRKVSKISIQEHDGNVFDENDNSPVNLIRNCSNFVVNIYKN
ncbi:hypothetical protein DD592_26315 [Enterobacter cloacae complex sp. 2DZ2F20B]|nr:hypothetical protein DD592_26315 [Enterobacter cloacae complex sp. 2DZ2F20B]